MIQRALGIGAVVLALDQASKWLILAVIMQPPRIIEVTGFFNIVLTYNTGVSFGLFAGSGPWRVWILVGLALAVVAALLVWVRRQERPWPAVAVGLIVGGALGNVIDRLHQPGVVDFLDVHAGGWHWPAFNLADSAIAVGVGVLLADGLFGGPARVK